jgi:DNA-binding NtrC family response regulator
MDSAEKVRVLIVDDDPQIVKLLGGVAHDTGFEPVEVFNPCDALNVAAACEVQIAIIDLHMPGLDGMEVMRALHIANEQMPVILITGDYSAKAFAEAIDTGAYELLWKPLDLRQLTDTLHSARQQITHGASLRDG